MADIEEENQEIVEVVQPEETSLGFSLPKTKITEVWDVALAGSISDQSRRSYFQGMLAFARFVLKKANRNVPEDDKEAMRQAAPLLVHVRFPLVTEFERHAPGKRVRRQDHQRAPRRPRHALQAHDALGTHQPEPSLFRACP